MDRIEWWLRRLGGLGALVVLASLYGGLWRARRQPLATGPARMSLLRRGPGMLAASVLFFEACRRLWRPLPWTLGRSGRIVAVVAGAPLYAVGLGLVLWGRLTLGDMFNFSTSRSAPLYSQQRLVTHGPFALVRHPMYLGYGLAAAGGLLLYRTWTTLLLLPAALGLALRARREEAALAARFGAEWKNYVQRVPACLPRLKPRNS